MNPGEPQESFLTVAEVAGMLKLNQQTVRNWIDQGSLPALRVGRRVRIKRSDFERVLAEASTAARAWRTPGRAPRTSGAASRSAWSIPGSGRSRRVSFRDDLDRQRAQIMRAVSQAGNDWAEAMRAHKLAPPDAGFAGRLRALSDAAAREQVAWEHAHAVGLLWRPIPGAETAEPPYELRAGTGRRGPPALWTHFDETVTALNRAITESSAADVADAFGELSDAAGALADAVAGEDEPAPQRAARAAP